MNARRLILAVLLCLLSAADRLSADAIFDFTYISTRNAAYNNKAHLMNTGIQVQPGDLLRFSGTGTIHVGGPYYIWSNFVMGLISPLPNTELMRNYQGVNTNYTAAAIPLAGESVLFLQQRTSLDDHRDLLHSVVVPSAGFVYLGIFDNFFADNTGQFQFQITRTIAPEPATALLLLVSGLALIRRRAK